MRQPIIYIDTSHIRDGMQRQLKSLIKDLKTFVENNIPQLISYAFFFDEDESEMTVVAVHPDSESLEYHLNTGNEQFKKFKDYIQLAKIEVYGEVSETVLQRLQKKAEMLGNGTVKLYNFFSGFSR